MQQLQAQYEAQTGDKVVLNLAGSNLLAHQIESTHAADLFFSADEAWIRYLEKRQLLVEASITPLLENRLVAVTRKDSALNPKDLDALTASEVHHIATGDPRSVPVGRYARHALEAAGVWDAVQSKIVPGSNVRSAVTATLSDPDIVGLIYRTDVLPQEDLRILFEIPEDETGSIRYYAAATKTAQLSASRDFLTFATGDKGRTVFTQYGYSPL